MIQSRLGILGAGPRDPRDVAGIKAAAQRPRPRQESGASGDSCSADPGSSELKVVELFAGVGGFRLGLERAGGFETVWFNQWEPSVKAQWAHNVYTARWPACFLSNEDVGKVPASAVPDHDLLVGGFPCQDYSVAATLATSRGIEGKKGVLWWEIRRLLEAKRPLHVLLENVDRLLISPAKQRGRDFSILLCCFRDLGYSVEWRIVNAAEYGGAQRRRRVFIYATLHEGNAAAIAAAVDPCQGPVMGRAFPATATSVRGQFEIPVSVGDVSDRFGARYLAAGTMVGGRVSTSGLKPNGTAPRALGGVLGICQNPARFIPEADLERWRYMKGKKDEQRATAGGFGYRYKEGAIAFPDHLNQPARTMLTDEGGASPGRSRHVVVDPGNGRLRLLQAVEAELLNDFPAGWTELAPEKWRFFLMGNALVVGMVERLGRALQESLHVPQIPGDPKLEEVVSSSEDPKLELEIPGVGA